MAETFSAQTELAADVADVARRRAMRSLHQSSLFSWRYRGTPIEQLVLVPQDLRTSDPSFATEIYNGQFGLAGAVALIGTESPYLVPPPSPEWQRQLHGFGWLRHLRAAGDEIAREHARVLVRDWIALHRNIRGIAWQPDIVARRIISWLSHAPIVLEGADQRFFEDVLSSLTRQMRYLGTAYRDMPADASRLTALTALMLTALCTEERNIEIEDYLKPFTREAERQILADGGHIARNPSILVEVLLDLLPLRQCFVVRDLPPPQALIGLIDRMTPMLRFFRLGDGGLARFNGMGATSIDQIVNVLAHDDVEGSPVTYAAPSGYCRLARGKAVVICDVGGPPPLALSSQAHAGCLSFEMSSGVQPVIVNCGAPDHIQHEWSLVTRSTAAHSTLTFADSSSSRFISLRPIGEPAARARLIGPEQVEAAITEQGGGQLLTASHDGYKSRTGVIHHRTLRLAANGEHLQGQDRLVAPEGLKPSAADGAAFAIRFHLHPAVRAELAQDGRSALLLLPNREGWRLLAGNGSLAIEDSVFLADQAGRNRTQQVVLSGELGNRTEVTVDWSLEKAVTPGAAKKTQTGTPQPKAETELPFAKT